MVLFGLSSAKSGKKVQFGRNLTKKFFDNKASLAIKRILKVLFQYSNDLFSKK